MLQRPTKPKPKSARARAAERRQRQRDGIAHVLAVKRNTKRLTTMLRAFAQARRPFPEGQLSKAELEVELDAFLAEVEVRWVGPAPTKK